jgi:hypothetical protein
MSQNLVLEVMVLAWAAMAQLAFAGDVSSMLPMPLFGGTLGAILNDVRTVSTISNTLFHDSIKPPGLARQASTGISSSISSMANTLVDINIYADMYLYVQAACSLIALQAGLLLAASMSIVALADVLLMRVHFWLLQVVLDIRAATEMFFSPLSLMKRALPTAGQVWRQMLPSSKQWWSSMDLQQDDFVYVACSFWCSCTYLVVYDQQVAYFNQYVPRWLSRFAAVWVYWYFTSKRLERHRQKARLAGALWLAAKLLCSSTDLPLPASAPKTMLLLAVLSFLAPEPSEEFLFATLEVIAKYCVGGFVWVCAWIAVAYRICSTLYKFTWVPLKVVFKVVASGVSAAFSRISSVITWVLVFVGAAEMSAASTVANWYRSQWTKLYLKYKYVRRIWRRTGGDMGAFVWQLLNGIEAGQGGSSSSSSKVARSGKGGKSGSKAAASRRASKPVSSSSARLQETASGEEQLSPVSSMNASYYNSTTSSSSDDEEDASLAELLTLFPAATTKGDSNSKKSQSKVKAAPQGKQQATRAAATPTAAPRTMQPTAAAAKPPPATSSSNAGRPVASTTGKGVAASGSKATASGMD